MDRSWIAFGSLATGLLPPERKQWAVLWSLKKEEHMHLPSFVNNSASDFLVSSFLPRKWLLAHHVDVFVTHCGLSSFTEAIQTNTRQ